jgi:hypothetical protein
MIALWRPGTEADGVAVHRPGNHGGQGFLSGEQLIVAVEPGEQLALGRRKRRILDGRCAEKSAETESMPGAGCRRKLCVPACRMPGRASAPAGAPAP